MYRSKVKVFVFSNEVDAVENTSMSFTVPCENPKEAKNKAREEFKEKYKTDYIIKTANMQGRDTILLYVISRTNANEIREKTIKKFMKGFREGQRKEIGG